MLSKRDIQIKQDGEQPSSSSNPIAQMTGRERGTWYMKIAQHSQEIREKEAKEEAKLASKIEKETRISRIADFFILSASGQIPTRSARDSLPKPEQMDLHLYNEVVTTIQGRKSFEPRHSPITDNTYDIALIHLENEYPEDNKQHQPMIDNRHTLTNSKGKEPAKPDYPRHPDSLDLPRGADSTSDKGKGHAEQDIPPAPGPTHSDEKINNIMPKLDHDKLLAILDKLRGKRILSIKNENLKAQYESLYKHIQPLSNELYAFQKNKIKYEADRAYNYYTALEELWKNNMLPSSRKVDLKNAGFPFAQD